MNISYILIHWNANSFAKRSCVLCFFSMQIIVPFFNGISKVCSPRIVRFDFFVTNSTLYLSIVPSSDVNKR